VGIFGCPANRNLNLVTPLCVAEVKVVTTTLFTKSGWFRGLQPVGFFIAICRKPHITAAFRAVVRRVLSVADTNHATLYVTTNVFTARVPRVVPGRRQGVPGLVQFMTAIEMTTRTHQEMR